MTLECELSLFLEEIIYMYAERNKRNEEINFK